MAKEKKKGLPLQQVSKSVKGGKKERHTLTMEKEFKKGFQSKTRQGLSERWRRALKVLFRRLEKPSN